MYDPTCSSDASRPRLTRLCGQSGMTRHLLKVTNRTVPSDMPQGRRTAKEKEEWINSLGRAVVRHSRALIDDTDEDPY